MTKKDFELIAATLRSLCETNWRFDDSAERDAIARAFAVELAYTNPRFNADRFITACLPKDGDA